ncbi:MAG: hypothetical protein JRN32_02850 [Nitrososphaerota archaeon]|jgi:hypothetical protein|nr:hypothetical protein [Nitrososphaerota archaeon]MDG7039080.1 hypothetical protein [Nitrososphaerota archaeon]MDG7040577.1 hypothetical protein [Nitrososphaerota archaeon]MDG7045739.1 hypothetical protein [Nitrososphaerota archaeon]MDG7048277.1 hypothetical protein [Nitrososphaerota archaeon]
MKATTIGLVVIAVVFIITTGIFASMYYSQTTAYSAQITSEKGKISQLSGTLSDYSSSAALATAMSHWNNIAIENVNPIVQQYESNATLKWVGGPLSGIYVGTGQIGSVWTKFTSLYETIYWYTITPPAVTQINSSYYVVTAPVQFFVAPTSNPESLLVLNVTETLGLAKPNTQAYTSPFLISSEIWSVAPLPLADVIAGYPGQNTLIADELLASSYAHWNNIAIENTSLITQEYAPNAALTWIGGPLQGNYTGIEQINSTWTRFTNLYEYVVWYAEQPPSISLSGTSATISSQLQFIAFPFNTTANPTPHAVLLYVNDTLQFTFSSGSWMLMHETWQVAPASISSAASGYSTPQFS